MVDSEYDEFADDDHLERTDHDAVDVVPREHLRDERGHNVTEVVVWKWVKIEMPDSDITVHVSLRDADGNRSTWLGYWDGERWGHVDGSRFVDEVTHWA